MQCFGLHRQSQKFRTKCDMRVRLSFAASGMPRNAAAAARSASARSAAAGRLAGRATGSGAHAPPGSNRLQPTHHSENAAGQTPGTKRRALSAGFTAVGGAATGARLARRRKLSTRSSPLNYHLDCAHSPRRPPAPVPTIPAWAPCLRALTRSTALQVFIQLVALT